MMLPHDLRCLLDSSGLPWRIEDGGRHRKVVVADRVVTILPMSNVALRRGAGRTRQNSLAFIRAGIRKAKEQDP